MARMLCLLAFLFVGAANAEIYRWVDERGVVHFSDRRPGARDAEMIEVEPSPTIPHEHAKMLRREREALLKEAERRQRALDKEGQRAAKRRQRARREAAQWRAKCESTREQIAAIESELRSGYSAARGEALHRRLEKYREREASQCH